MRLASLPSAGPVLEYAAAEWRHWSVGFEPSPFHEVRLEVQDPAKPGPEGRLDPSRDAYAVRPEGDVLRLIGSSPRATLYAVHAALRRLGVDWPSPGEAGARRPAKPRWEALDQPFREAAAFPLRGWSLEGGYTLASLIEHLDWAVRQRLNTVHFQFTDMRTFFRRAVPDLDLPTALDWDAQAFAAARARGLDVHRGGHGFLPLLLGLPDAQGWDEAPQPWPAEVGRYAALLDGKRALFRGQPANTQVCLSRKGVAEALTRVLSDYIASHPGTDTLSLWLGDGVHNWCQCPDCAKIAPSRAYLDLVQHLAEELKPGREGRPKLAYIAYTNILEPPDGELQAGPGTCFQFAPWGRSYGRALGEDPLPAVLSYRQASDSRRFQRWPSTAEYAALWRQWRSRLGETPSQLFDYHLWPALWRLYTPHSISQTLSLDLRWLAAEGGAGLLACQAPRNHWPDGLFPSLQASLLWDPTQDPAALTAAYLRCAYGYAAPQAQSYYAALESRAASARAQGAPDSSAAWELPQTGKLPGELALFNEFLTHERAMERGAPGALEAYKTWLGAHRRELEPKADPWELEMPHRFGVEWHRNVGWSGL